MSFFNPETVTGLYCSSGKASCRDIDASRSCICGACAMTINGENRLACETRVASLSHEPVEVEPLRSMPVVKDLVVDMTELFERYKLVRPYLIANGEPPERERLQSQAERKLLDGSYECILCGSCTSSCPSFWARREFLGPSALLAASRWVLDSRDEATDERLRALDSPQGLWRCHNIFNCVEACPKGLNPTRAIARLRRQSLKRRFGGE